jgi:hypothetical protein
MEAQVARLTLDGQNVRFERATLVEFLGWRLVLVGADLKDTGVEADRPVALTVDGERLVGTVRTRTAADPGSPPPPRSTATATRNQTVLKGVGALRRPGDRAE